MSRLVSPVVRAVLATLSVVASAGTTFAQPDPTAPPPRPASPGTVLPAPTTVPSAKPPEPVPMGWSAYPSPGAAFVAYPGMPAFYYPGYGYGYGYVTLPPRAVYGPSVSPTEYPYGSVPGYPVGGGTLPPRAVYGPSVSPTEYPYTGFVPGYPYPGYAALSPYPRTVSSYSSGPSKYPLIGPVSQPRYWRR
ncbi:MAG: hypothetical protein JWO38_113 [Gemmataceae bacterium]|nr:hypothetical protein [Gemmataceae bacterium]